MAEKHRGLDYTPLFRFLLSNVGNEWDTIHREAVSRLDKPDPIFWLVAHSQEEGQEYVRVGQSTFFSGMYVDQENKLALVNPSLTVEDIIPFCKCCTHTLNGKIIPNREK